MHPLTSCQGDVVPLTPTRFLEKAGQKLLRVTAETLRINPERSEHKSFLSTFFQKSGGFQRQSLWWDFKGRSPLTTKGGETVMDWLLYEKGLMDKGYKTICGVDEAGRGPLAGEVYAAAVILRPNELIENVNDSKKLSEKKREKLFDVIREQAIAYSIAYASVEEIEEMNILKATMLAMKRAVENLMVKPDYVIVDGNKTPDLTIPCQAIVKGDAKSLSIASASILAKVSRDRKLREYALQYPQYGFEKHKGYGTKAHVEALQQYGVCKIHRKSFLKKILENRE